MVQYKHLKKKFCHTRILIVEKQLLHRRNISKSNQSLKEKETVKCYETCNVNPQLSKLTENQLFTHLDSSLYVLTAYRYALPC